MQLETSEDGNPFYVDDGSTSEDEEGPRDSDVISEEEITVPSLKDESIMEGRLQRERIPPPRYNPANG